MPDIIRPTETYFLSLDRFKKELTARFDMGFKATAQWYPSTRINQDKQHNITASKWIKQDTWYVRFIVTRYIDGAEVKYFLSHHPSNGLHSPNRRQSKGKEIIKETTRSLEHRLSVMHWIPSIRVIYKTRHNIYSKKSNKIQHAARITTYHSMCSSHKVHQRSLSIAAAKRSLYTGSKSLGALS
jgi:hypothetical protein